MFWFILSLFFFFGIILVWSLLWLTVYLLESFLSHDHTVTCRICIVLISQYTSGALLELIITGMIMTRTESQAFSLIAEHYTKNASHIGGWRGRVLTDSWLAFQYYQVLIVWSEFREHVQWLFLSRSVCCSLYLWTHANKMQDKNRSLIQQPHCRQMSVVGLGESVGRACAHSARTKRLHCNANDVFGLSHLPR